ncbi:conjugal transfer protein TraD [Vibrio mediterranei]|jgi:type IV secretion system protein VirB3|uniref:conjugal transfer protein TraD n=1 Tax=Vibrio mediterranei TaxID=689 RepID=UPI001EFD9508|nr:conjugal transfer protein TraD [Vibrio mediterranei]MCG9625410.1 conjugal transfer protein TraD [Vibrio mediterranei]
MEEERELYASYNSLSRKPLIGGIPVIALVMGCGAMLLTGFGGLAFFGAKGLVLPAFFALGLLYIRIRSMEDSRAIEDIQWELKGLLTRLRCQSTTLSFTSMDNQTAKRKSHVSEWFKNNSPN